MVSVIEKDNDLLILQNSGTAEKRNISRTGMILLAGGESRRMAYPKANLKWGDKTFLDCLLDKAINIGFGDIYISANEPIEGCEIIRDENIGIGPVEGIFRALKRSRFDKNFVISVDVPQIPEYIIRGLIKEAYRGDFECTFLSCGGYIEPLIAVYDKSTIPYFEEMIRNEQYAVKDVSNKARTILYVYKGDADFVKSINNSEEYNRLKRRFIYPEDCEE